MTPFLRSFSYAFKGLVFSLKQRNMKIIFSSALITIFTAFFLKVNANDWCILLICIGSVISLEMMNCAIEGIVDIIHPQRGEQAGKIKDLAAGAVLIVSIISLIVGVIILGKYFLIFIHQNM
ncbi:MAG TPA: diacylglycerol kinase family protein [Bacteroidia bacterium]|jgi:diacylglycerol kinase (ATP)|nr:diacylglycerol kinase family protein [Bacteroidia bacterium]